MKAKRDLALLMATVMVMSTAACGKSNTETTAASTTAASETTVAATEGETSGNGEVAAAEKYPAINAGSITVDAGSQTGGEVGYDVYSGVEGKDYTDEAVYTFNDYLSGTTDMKWSTHTWETSDDDYVLSLISSGFYGFALNPDCDGWSVTCEMAAELPEDVTADYVGSYGISEGETGKAWKIALNPDACWEDGTPINADSYMYSYKELLDPVMKNRRADSIYAGDFVVYNAKNYFYQGKTVWLANSENDGYEMSDLVLGADGVYTTPDGSPLYIGLQYGYEQCSGYTMSDLHDMEYVTDEVFNGLSELADDEGYVPATEEAVELLLAFITSDAWGNEPEENVPLYLSTKQSFDAMDFDQVGILKTGEYEIVFITVNAIENPNYYVPYNLSSVYLVYPELWESCKTYYNSNGDRVTADSSDIASISTTYCTDVATTMSFGPYKLTYFELDKQLTFERNENWYGYSDGKHLGQYQTDIISTQVIGEHATALLAFLNGELDNITLVSADMADYGTSDYIRYTPQSYTTKLTFNTDESKLAERGTSVLANINFRHAFSLAIDRSTFAASYTSAGSAGYGLLNYMYIADPFSGLAYRETDGAKSALADLYGLTYGADGDFDDLDEAYEAITGYDLAQAQELMQLAYDQCVADGSYDGTSAINIQLSVYSSDDTYVQMFNFLNSALQSACSGTDFDGKVSLSMVVDADYYNTMYSGNTDLIFSTWGGSASSPYTLLYECYSDASDGSGNQMEYGFDTTQVKVTIEINGVEYTTDLQTWALWADGDASTVISSGSNTLDKFNSYDVESRAAIFGRLEYAYLSNFVNMPLYYRNTASLMSQKGDYATTQYIDSIVGFGGLQFYTYNYNDTEWASVVAGGLSY
jgi:oligopeptide transport system substrate-binding protein